MSETEEPTGRHRVIGTPSSAPTAVDVKPPAPREAADYVSTDPADPGHAKRAEMLAAVCFLIAFAAGVCFLIAYTGLDPIDDPRWLHTGASDQAEYGRWCRHCCGMACLQMILEHRDGTALGRAGLGECDPHFCSQRPASDCCQ